MKLIIMCVLIIAATTILSTTSYSNYFYDDKKFSDILIANKLTSKWVAVPESQIPRELKTLIVTKDDIDGKKICLVPLKVLLFNNDGTFRYLWEKDSSSVGEISGKWRVENSVLIFTLGKDYSSAYKANSELRYKILKTLHADTSLKYSGTNYPGISGIIKTTDDPLNDFANIVISIEKGNVKNLKENKLNL